MFKSAQFPSCMAKDRADTWNLTKVAYHATAQKHGNCDDSRYTMAQSIQYVSKRSHPPLSHPSISEESLDQTLGWPPLVEMELIHILTVGSFIGNNTPAFTVPPNLDTYQDPPSGENFTSQAMDEGEMPFDGVAWI